MAACFFLLKQFDDVLLYLNSIKSYFYNDDTFNFNYGQAKAAVGQFRSLAAHITFTQPNKNFYGRSCLFWTNSAWNTFVKEGLLVELKALSKKAGSPIPYLFFYVCNKFLTYIWQGTLLRLKKFSYKFRVKKSRMTSLTHLGLQGKTQRQFRSSDL